MKTMKTTKSIKEPKDVSGTKETVKRKKIKTLTYSPTEEEIREKAKEIYLQRIERGEYNTPEHDWIEAEKYLRDSK